MAITAICHVESVAGSKVTSVVVTCQRVEEPCGIHRRKWSRVGTIIVVCQRVMEPHGIHHRKWSRVVAIIVICQGVQTCQPKFGWGSISVEARMGIICRGVSVKACLQQRSERNSSIIEAQVKAYGGNPARTAHGRNLKQIVCSENSKWVACSRSSESGPYRSSG